MAKNYYLSRKEQEIFNSLKDLSVNVISSEQIKDLFRKENTNKICSNLERKGYLFRVKKGIYLINKEQSKKPLINDPLLIAQSLYKGYLGFSSALKIHGLLEYEPFTIFLITNYKSEEISIGQYTFKIINLGKRAQGQTKIGDYIASNLEKTFFDCFYKPQYAGGFSNITKALYDAKIDWTVFLGYFREFAANSLCQRTGYMLERMAIKTNYKIPKTIIKFMKSKATKNTKLLFKGSGKYIKEWKLIDNSKGFLGWYGG